MDLHSGVPFVRLIICARLSDEATSENEKLDAEMENYLAGLWPDYGAAWSLNGELDPTSPNAVLLDQSFTRLERKCGVGPFPDNSGGNMCSVGSTINEHRR